MNVRHSESLVCTSINFFGEAEAVPHLMLCLFKSSNTMLAYVTSLYAVRDDYLPVLYQNFQQLVPHLLAPVVVFTDRAVPFALPAHFKVIEKPLEAFETYEKCMSAMATARLPKQRNPQKDTAEFMALMNTKVEMMWEAVLHLGVGEGNGGVTHVAWIDAGIMKIVNQKEKAVVAFASQRLTCWPARSVVIPGCWSACAPSSDSICWRFCGGFLVAPVGILEAFYRAVDTVLEKWLRAGHLAWEVNIWAALEWEEAAWFTWWGADHNLTMLEPPGFLGST